MATGEWLSQNEIEYLINGEFFKAYPLLQEHQNYRLYSLGDIGVSSRYANYWAQKEAMPVLTSSKGRRKYTLKEAIWIKFIIQLRSMDVGLTTIKKIKDSLLAQVTPSIEQLLNDENLQSILKEKMGVEQFKELVQNIPTKVAAETINQFELLIQYCIIFQHPISLLITPDGQAIPYSVDKHDKIIEMVPEFRELFSQPMIHLSVNGALAGLAEDWKDKKWFPAIPFLSEDEKKVIDLIRQPNFSKVIIHKKGNHPDRAEVTSSIEVKDVSSFTNHILKNGYHTLTVKTRNGKAVSFTRTDSIKLNNQ